VKPEAPANEVGQDVSEVPAPKVLAESVLASASFIKVVLFGLVVLGALGVIWFAYVSASLEDSPKQTSIAPVVSAASLEPDPQPQVLPIDPPALMDLHVVSDQPMGVVWVDDALIGDVTENGLTITGVEPGVRHVKVSTPTGDVEMTFEFSPGQIPTPISLPSRQVADVLFVAGSEGKSHAQCNCVPAGLRVGDRAELMRESGLEMPLDEGQHKAELWVGKNYRKLTIPGGRLPVATVGVFSMSSNQ
jgi:hypothetical protein